MNDSLHTQTERAADIRRDRDELRQLLNAERRAAQIVGAEHKKDVRERDELRAEVERLKRLYDDVYAENQRLNQALDMLAEERAAWEADNERLRAALREIEALPLGRRWTSCDIAEAALAHPTE